MSSPPADARDALVEHVDGEPAADPAARRGAVHRHRDRRVDERERQPVVETGLGGEREPHLVLGVLVVGRLADLHVGGEHRVGRRERGAEQQRRGRHQARPPPAEHGDGGDRQRHRDRQQPPRRRPAPPAERPVDLEPGAHQRDDHADLGQVGGQRRLGQRVGAGQAGGQGEDEHADGEEHDRHRQRAPLEQARQHTGEQRTDPEQGERQISGLHQASAAAMGEPSEAGQQVGGVLVDGHRAGAGQLAAAGAAAGQADARDVELGARGDVPDRVADEHHLGRQQAEARAGPPR